MKTILCLLLLSPIFSDAQQVAFGFKNGFTLAQLTGDGNRGYHQFGYSGGLSSQLNLNEHFKLQLDVLFVTKGRHFKINQPSSSTGDPYSVALFYIEFPLLVVYNYKKLILELGPGIGYLVGQQREYIPGASLFFPSNDYSKTEKSIHTGIGAYFNKRWGGIIRYSNSLIPVRTEPSRQYNSVISGAIFFLTSFKKG